MLRGLWGDFRFAGRVLVKHRIPSLVIITTLALAVGANTALYSIVHQVLLAPLPFQQEEQLYFLWQGPGRGSVSPRNYQDWKEQTRLFDVAAFDSSAVTVTETSEPQRLNALQATHDFASLLGLELDRGRFFSESEDRPGGEPVALISHRLWVQEFASAPDILNREIIVDGIPHAIIGVLSEDFEFLGETPQNRFEVMLPISFTDRQLEESQRGAQWIGVVGRLKEGETLAQARQEFASITTRLKGVSDWFPADFEVTFVPVREEMVGTVETMLWALFCAVAAVLLVAVLNVAGLMLARSARRRGEFAVRSALGAGKLQLFRQSLVESLVLATLAGGFGWLLALLAKDLLIAIAPAGIPRLGQSGLSLPVLLFNFLITAGTGLLLGLTPVVSALRLNLVEALTDVQRSAQTRGFSRGLASGLVLAEIALAVMVLSTAGLLARSLLKLEAVEEGFDARNVLRFRLSLPDSHYDTAGRVDRFYGEFLQQLEGLPGVVAAGAVMHLPLGRDGNVFSSFSLDQAGDDEDDQLTNLRPVTPGYFEAMGIPILSGRDFRAGDDLEAPGVMIVNETFAETFSPDQPILGRRVRPHVGLAERGRWANVVGVVGDVHHRSLAEDPVPEVFIPHAQSPVSNMSLVVRSRTDTGDLVRDVRRIVRDLDPNLPLFNVETLSEVRAASLAPARFRTLLFASFAGVALFLATVGIFGLISYQIAARVPEIGLRRALGAQDRQILRLVARQGFILISGGLLAGLAGAWLAARWVQSLLFEIEPTDLPTLLFLTGVLLISGLAASLYPAVRALKITPLTALRS